MEVEAIVEPRIGKVDEVTASDWHLVGVQLHFVVVGKSRRGRAKHH